MLKKNNECVDGGCFEATVGRTHYEVVVHFRESGMTMQEKAIRAVKGDFGTTAKK